MSRKTPKRRSTPDSCALDGLTVSTQWLALGIHLYISVKHKAMARHLAKNNHTNYVKTQAPGCKIIVPLSCMHWHNRSNKILFLFFACSPPMPSSGIATGNQRKGARASLVSMRFADFKDATIHVQHNTPISPPSTFETLILDLHPCAPSSLFEKSRRVEVSYD